MGRESHERFRDMKALVVYPVLLIAAVACGDAPIGPLCFSVSAGTNTQNLAYLQAGADEINTRLGSLRIVLDDNSPNTIRFHPTNWAQSDGIEWGVTERLPDAISIELDDFASLPDFWFCTELGSANQCVGTEERLPSNAAFIAEHTIVHEFGHALGLTFPDNAADPKHSANPDDIMFSSIDPSVTTKWSDAQWARFVSEWHETQTGESTPR